MSTRLLLFATVAALGAPGSLLAATFPVNHAVPDARLDTIRGGYDLADNIRASFALERTVLVNGAEAIRTSVNIPDIANITQQQAADLANALNTTVVTNGVGGVVTNAVSSVVPATTSATSAAGNAGTTAGGAATQAVSSVATATLPIGTAPGLIVQNSLDNQTIKATTTIDASVNTAGMLQNLRLDEAVKDAVIQFRGN